MTALSIIVASSGRPSLARTLDSIRTQMEPGDELLLSVNDEGHWGSPARSKMMQRAAGDCLLFMDDDDVYAPDSFSKIREAYGRRPFHLHVFRMQCEDGHLLWRFPDLVVGNVGTPMLCVPNRPDLRGEWGMRYEGDFDFAQTTARRVPVCWHEDVIALIRPAA